MDLFKNNLSFSYDFDHVGIAVSSLEKTIPFYESLGFRSASVEEVTTEGVRVAMYQLENRSRIELLEPLHENSPIAKFLQKKGPGVHHICLRVKNLREILKKLKAENIRLIYDEPRPGAHGCLISFIHPSDAGGVLIELSQPKEEKSLASVGG